MTDLGRELHRAVRDGRLTAGQARRIGGHLLTEPFGDLEGDSRATRFRLRAEAAAFGFHLQDGVLEPLRYDLGAAFEEAERPQLWRDGSVSGTAGPDPDHDRRDALARELSDARPRGEAAPASGSPGDSRWRDARGRQTEGPARPEPLRDQFAARPPVNRRPSRPRPDA